MSALAILILAGLAASVGFAAGYLVGFAFCRQRGEAEVWRADEIASRTISESRTHIFPQHDQSPNNN